jgi:hypothetical protein
MPYGYTPAAVSRLAFALATMPGPATPKTSRGAWSYEAARAARYVTDHTFRHVSDTYFFTNQIISYQSRLQYIISLSLRARPYTCTDQLFFSTSSITYPIRAATANAVASLASKFSRDRLTRDRAAIEDLALLAWSFAELPRVLEDEHVGHFRAPCRDALKVRKRVLYLVVRHFFLFESYARRHSRSRSSRALKRSTPAKHTVRDDRVIRTVLRRHQRPEAFPDAR